MVYAATLSSLSTPRMTIRNASSGKGRCNALASSQGANVVDGAEHQHRHDGEQIAGLQRPEERAQKFSDLLQLVSLQ